MNSTTSLHRPMLEKRNLYDTHDTHTHQPHHNLNVHQAPFNRPFPLTHGSISRPHNPSPHASPPTCHPLLYTRENVNDTQTTLIYHLPFPRKLHTKSSGINRPAPQLGTHIQHTTLAGSANHEHLTPFSAPALRLFGVLRILCLLELHLKKNARYSGRRR